MKVSNTANDPKTGRRVAHVVIMIVFMFGIQLLATLLLAIMKLNEDPALNETVTSALAEGDSGPYNELMSSVTFMGTIIGGILALLPYIIRDVSKKSYCVSHINPLYIPVILSLGVVLNALSTTVVSMFEDQGGETTTNLILGSEAWVAVLSVGIVTPIVEEMFYRRAIVNSLWDRNRPIAALASALVFSMFHAGTVQRVYAFIFGLLFAAIYVKTGNLLYSILLHIAINLSSTLSAIAGDAADKYTVPVLTVCTVITVAAGIAIFIKRRRRA